MRETGGRRPCPTNGRARVTRMPTWKTWRGVYGNGDATGIRGGKRDGGDGPRSPVHTIAPYKIKGKVVQLEEHS